MAATVEVGGILRNRPGEAAACLLPRSGQTRATQNPEDGMTIRELMSGGLITVRRDTPVLEARDLMAREKIRHLLVTNAARTLEGIVTDRDIRLNLPSRATSLSVWEINHLLTKLTVEEVMTRSVITVGPDQPAHDGAQLMIDRKIGALPVVEDGCLIGIVTETDLVRAFVAMSAPRSRQRGEAD
jgi:acetoin utilization protein AcuB